jgi:hypothetical protein
MAVPQRKMVSVNELSLDLHNFRTIPQKGEASAIHAMIAIEPDRLWALMNSLLDDGFSLAESILVIKSGPKGKKLTVAEGNRRIAAMKLALGFISPKQFALPDDVQKKIDALDGTWKKANSKVPCTVYDAGDATAVDRAVALIHGKGEKAGRDPWSSIARARHNRDKGMQSQIDLDLLEGYLAHGKNASETQKEHWAGDYPLTVLEEAIKRIAPRLGFKTGKDLVASYPKDASNRAKLESVLLDIGSKTLGFKELRDATQDRLLTNYGIPALVSQGGGTSTSGSGQSGSTGSAGTATTGGSGQAGGSGSGAGGGGTTGGTGSAGSGKKSQQSHPSNDYRAVRRALRDLAIKQGRREKVALLRNELVKLDLRKTPHAFCFVLRSVFEISAKAYCDDHKSTGGPSAQKSPGQDKALVDVLREIVTHLTKNKTDKDMLKRLTGAMAELGKNDGFLSVTSMNQLVHHKSFNVNESHICGLFFNVFPLIEQMNA